MIYLFFILEQSLSMVFLIGLNSGSKKIQIFEIPKVEINCPCKVLLFEEGDNIQKAVPTYMVEIPTLKEEVNMPIEKDIKYKILIGNNEIAYLLE